MHAEGLRQQSEDQHTLRTEAISSQAKSDASSITRVRIHRPFFRCWLTETSHSAFRITTTRLVVEASSGFSLYQRSRPRRRIQSKKKRGYVTFVYLDAAPTDTLEVRRLPDNNSRDGRYCAGHVKDASNLTCSE
jgi:hypothetical protein